jgi:hypothetical protein
VVVGTEDVVRRDGCLAEAVVDDPSASGVAGADHRGLVGGDVDEGDVDVAGLDGVDQLGAVSGLTQPDPDAGPLGAEGPKQARILVPTLTLGHH